MNSYQATISLEQRQAYSNNIRKNYEGILPVILLTPKNEHNISLKKFKFLVPESVSIRKFLITAQTYTNVPESSTVFLTVKGVAPCMENTMGSLYQKYKDIDGFLYLHISSENCFGGCGITEFF